MLLPTPLPARVVSRGRRTSSPLRGHYLCVCLPAALESEHETSPNWPLGFQVIKGRQSKSETFGSWEPDLPQESWCLLKSSKGKHENGPCFRLSPSHLSCLEPFLQHWNQKLQEFSFLPPHTSLLARFQNILQAHGSQKENMCGQRPSLTVCTWAKLFSKLRWV